RRGAPDRAPEAPLPAIGARPVDPDDAAPIRVEEARAAALRRVVAEVSANLELDEVFDDVLESTRQLFRTDAAGLWLLSPNRFPFRLASHHDLPQELIDAVGDVGHDSPVVGLRAINERRSIVLDDPASAPH